MGRQTISEVAQVLIVAILGECELNTGRAVLLEFINIHLSNVLHSPLLS